MINYYYVYLILSENRLVIMENKFVNDDYHLLMDNNGENKISLYNTCKIFCLGYLYGSRSNGRIIINDPHEYS